MADTKETKAAKVSEIRFVIFIPLLVTAICVWLDILLSEKEFDFLNILKMIYTYFFPSIASTMITLIIQKCVYKNEAWGIDGSKIWLASLLLVLYALIYITYLEWFNLGMAIVFGLFSVFYMAVTWCWCLDKEITHNNPVAEERAAAQKAINQ